MLGGKTSWFRSLTLFLPCPRVGSLVWGGHNRACPRCQSVLGEGTCRGLVPPGKLLRLGLPVTPRGTQGLSPSLGELFHSSSFLRDLEWNKSRTLNQAPLFTKIPVLWGRNKSVQLKPKFSGTLLPTRGQDSSADIPDVVTLSLATQSSSGSHWTLC